MKARYLEYGGKLALICVACILGVAAAYVGARDRIARGEKAVFTAAIAEVLGTDPDPSDDDPDVPFQERVFRATVNDEVRYAAKGTFKGYSGDVEVAVGARLVDGELVIVEARVVKQTETPGLGTRIAEQETNLDLWKKIGNLMGAGIVEKTDWAFLKQYRDKRVENLVLTGDRAEADEKILRITGVTISSNACTQAARNALLKIRREISKEGGEER